MLGGGLGQGTARAERGLFPKSSNLPFLPQISLPLVGKSDCEAKLKPEFRERGVESAGIWNLDETWKLHSSELCAGGEVGVDTCEGEGGAPLVCLDQVRLSC